MSKPGWADARDVKWMRDMEKEQMQEAATKEDPRSKPMLCKCGHRLSRHYQLTQAMPCRDCNCMYCTAPNAEPIRRERKRLGLDDITPHPAFKKPVKR